MVEGTALEMRHTRKGIVGSNPTLSAIWRYVVSRDVQIAPNFNGMNDFVWPYMTANVQRYPTPSRVHLGVHRWWLGVC